MVHGIIRRIGDGETTNIWEDNWLPRANLKRPITSLVPQPPIEVSELIDHTSSSWNVNLVRSVFIPTDAAAILQIPLCTRQMEDFWAWSE